MALGSPLHLQNSVTAGIVRCGTQEGHPLRVDLSMCGHPMPSSGHAGRSKVQQTSYQRSLQQMRPACSGLRACITCLLSIDM